VVAAVAELGQVAFASLRAVGVLATAPVWSSRYLPWPLRAVLALYLGLALAPVVQPAVTGATAVHLLLVAATELVTGLALGYAAGLTFAAVQVAGHLVDMEMGFGIVNVIDPNLGQPSPVAGTFLYLLAMLLFLQFDGHHLLLAALADSFRVIPLAGATWGGPPTQVLIRASGQVFWLALRIALPVVGALFVATVALGLVARSVPQMNVFIVGLPVKIASGLFLLAASLPVYALVVQLLAGESRALMVRIATLLGSP
jgi:flagellar biosynthetic protein FliR